MSAEELVYALASLALVAAVVIGFMWQLAESLPT